MLPPPRDPHLLVRSPAPWCQINRANALLSRYWRHGQEDDLEAAITLATMPPSPTRTCLPLVAPPAR